MAEIPNPGSKEAIETGCKCPVLDNAHGEGLGRLHKEFWISGDCPLHYAAKETSEDEDESV